MSVVQKIILIIATLTASYESFVLNINNPKAFTLFSDLVETQETITPSEALNAKKELLRLGESTNRGFTATRDERKQAKDLTEILQRNNPTETPATAFYENAPSVADESNSICGKWTLVYTDAPDITTLDSGGPFPAAKLGRIGQECSPPFIKNVIEWKRPEWLPESLPFSGNANSRVLQKVACEASASREDPLTIDLKLVGLDLLGDGATSSDGPGTFFEKNPVELRGFLKAPFGKCEILYLDEDMRIIRTNQNYLAVNMRSNEDWF